MTHSPALSPSYHWSYSPSDCRHHVRALSLSHAPPPAKQKQSRRCTPLSVPRPRSYVPRSFRVATSASSCFTLPLPRWDTSLGYLFAQTDVPSSPLSVEAQEKKRGGGGGGKRNKGITVDRGVAVLIPPRGLSSGGNRCAPPRPDRCALCMPSSAPPVLRVAERREGKETRAAILSARNIAAAFFLPSLPSRPILADCLRHEHVGLCKGKKRKRGTCPPTLLCAATLRRDSLEAHVQLEEPYPLTALAEKVQQKSDPPVRLLSHSGKSLIPCRDIGVTWATHKKGKKVWTTFLSIGILAYLFR